MLLNYINLNVINVSSTVMVEVSDQLKSKALGINVISLGCLKLNVFCNNLILNVSSSGFVVMSLNVNNLEAGISSAGYVELID